MSSNDERKIPKIVLKLGAGAVSKSDASRPISGIEADNQIFSLKISEWTKDYAKVASFERGFLKLPSLLRKINQNSYKSIENVLELMGRMNDVEKKKTLHQVLSSIRGAYKKLLIIIEFLKVLNEYFAVKMIRKLLISSRSNLDHVHSALNHCHVTLCTKSQIDPYFNSVKSMLLSKNICPDYFSYSIQSLSKPEGFKSSDIMGEFWTMTLEVQLRSELTKVLCFLSENEARVISIVDGKAKVCFKNLFEFEFTLVPSGVNSATSWFILSVHVDTLKSIFKNSLTGIFQSKYNYFSVSDRSLFQSIAKDCSNYVNLFYFEKLCSQFSFFSKTQSKNVCDFHQNSSDNSFTLKPWFMVNEFLIFYLDSQRGLRMKQSSNITDSLVVSKVSFSEDEFVEIFENLFASHFVPKLHHFLDHSKQKGLFEDFSVSESFEVELLIIYSVHLHIRFDPLSKSVKLRLFNCTLDESKLSSIYKVISESMIDLNRDAFSEAILNLKKHIVLHLLIAHENAQTLACPEINSSTGFCVHLLEMPNFAISINLSVVSDAFEFGLWSLETKFNQGNMNLKFKKVEIAREAHYAFPKVFEDLLAILKAQLDIIPNLSKSDLISKVVKHFNFEGKFLNRDSYLLYTFGQPSIVKSIILCSHSESEISIKFNLENDDEFIMGVFESNLFSQLFSIISNILRLLSIYEALRFSEDDGNVAEVESFSPLRIKMDGKFLLWLERSGEVAVSLNGQRNSILEKYFESDTFNVYEFVDMIHNQNNSEKSNANDNSLQDTAWLSGSFM